MTNEDLRAAIEAALRRRDPCANVCSGDAPDGFSGRDASALVMHGYAASRGDSDDEALRRLARLLGLRDDGSDPAEEVERMTRELAEARAALLVMVPECYACGNPATTYTSDHSYVATTALHLCDFHRSGRGADLPHANALRAAVAR